ncbi:hypothetical protein BDN72DRAFT_844744 [Pluteus cervinus]|uniref:Uncharacterized protein n=1 Tax=Pluteus cervinus TaxID=181527 RepID=A0ACD3ALA0_9AGAR|nr:hypothetical protein BDN72DRAFT_844744 [Pluteus cervinus]
MSYSVFEPNYEPSLSLDAMIPSASLHISTPPLAPNSQSRLRSHLTLTILESFPLYSDQSSSSNSANSPSEGPQKIITFNAGHRALSKNNSTVSVDTSGRTDRCVKLGRHMGGWMIDANASVRDGESEAKRSRCVTLEKIWNSSGEGAIDIRVKGS